MTDSVPQLRFPFLIPGVGAVLFGSLELDAFVQVNHLQPGEL